MTDATPVPLPWLFAVLFFAGSLVAFVFSTFETKADAKEKDDDKEKAVMRLEGVLTARLDRMEDKLDRMLDR